MAGKGGSDGRDAHAETAIASPSAPGTDSTMAAPAGAHLASTSPPSDPFGEPPRELGTAPPPSQRYVDQGELARGGLGRISRARDRHLGRAVVVKEMLRRGRDEGRFVREVMVTASLQHPAIVPVYDAGRWASGEPFFAMRPIEGRHLGDALAAATTLDARLALLPNLLRAAEAVAYAHAHGVIHRDLKPSNILVGAYGDTVVIDWGLAKRIGARDDAAEAIDLAASDGTHTVAGMVMGTPAYMPPEQAESSDAVDARADVYALGAILYQLLAGTPPFTGSSSEQILDRVRSEPPPPILERVPAAPRDLVAIVDKAMAREAAARYADAGELVVELERFTTGRLVAAHEYTRRELIVRYVRKHRAAVTVAAVALATAAVAGTIAVTQIIRARDTARVEGARALIARDEAEQSRKAADERSAALLVEQARAQAARDPFGALATLARIPADVSSWPAAGLVAADAVGTGLPRELDLGEVERFTVSGDGKVLAAVLASGQVHVWDESLTTTRALEGTSASPNLLVLSRDGRWLFAADPTGRLLHWSTASGEMRTLRETGPEIFGAWPRADGSVVIYDDGPVVFPAGGGAEARPLGRRTGASRTFSRWDSRYVVESQPQAAGQPPRGPVHVIDLETASVSNTFDAATSDIHSTWYSASWDRRVQLVGGVLHVDGKTRPVQGDLVSPDGALVISERERGITVYYVAQDRIEPVSASPDAVLIGFLGQSHVLAVRERTTVHLVDLGHDSDHPLETGAAEVHAGEHWVAVRAGARGLRIVDSHRASSVYEVLWDRGTLVAASPAGHWYALGRRTDTYTVYGPAGEPVTIAAAGVRGLAFSPDDAWMVIVQTDGATRLRDLATAKEATLALPANIDGLWVGPDAAWVIATTPGRAVAWRRADGPLHELADDTLVDATAAGPRVITTTARGEVTVWDERWAPVRTLATTVEAQTLEVTLVGLAEQRARARFAAVPSGDGTRLAVVDPVLRVVDVDSGAEVWRAGDAHAGCDPEMIASGRLLAHCGDVAVVLDAADGRVVRALATDEALHASALAPDGKRAFTIHRTHARVWDVDSGAWRRMPWSESWTYTAVFEGRTVRAVDRGGVVVVPEDVPGDPAALRAWLATFASPENADGGTRPP